jgi:biopolymer transport protein ExbD
MQGGFRISTGERRRRAGDSFVPMINIVFLLLIFFLLSATIAPPDPFDMTLPDADLAETGEGIPADTLVVSAAGEVMFGTASGEAALEAIALRAGAGPLILRVDAGYDGAAFAALLARLAERGLAEVRLTVRQP